MARVLSLTVRVTVLASAGLTLACSGEVRHEGPIGYTTQGLEAGVYRLVATHSGRCLEVVGGATNNGANIAQNACAAGDHQQWEFVRRPNGSFRALALHSRKCMRAYRDSNVQQGRCIYKRSKWQVSDLGGNLVQLESVKTGNCVEIIGGSLEVNANARQYTCGQVASQQFYAVPAGDAFCECDEVTACCNGCLLIPPGQQPVCSPGTVPVDMDGDYCPDSCQPVACLNNAQCGDAATYCSKPVGSCDAEGSCTERPISCPDIWDPVCGCDGSTYGNACEAAAAGVNVDYAGECLMACLDNQHCAVGEYCAKSAGDCAGEGRCEATPLSCPEIWDPVCGCDGTTYSNACFAAAAGVNVAAAGECLQL